MGELSRRWQIAGGIVIALMFPLGFWLDVMVLRFYSWMGWT